MISQSQLFYLNRLEYLECALSSKGCHESMKPYYEARRKEALEKLLEWQLKEFDRN